jgi:hypothetical protein
MGLCFGWLLLKVGLQATRVLTNVGSFQNEEQLATRAIIEDDLARTFEQFITDIVDGANNKWIGTADSGVYGSQTGKETKYHFTE